MKVIMFQPRFAALVMSGAKRQTIRPRRRHQIQVGDTLSLREWIGKPYRSKQREIRTAVCSNVSEIRITEPIGLTQGLAIGHWIIAIGIARDQFARADGFESFSEMLEWFSKTHGLPFTGVLIEW